MVWEVEEYSGVCKCLLFEFAIVELNCLYGEDAYTCGRNDILDCGEPLSDEGLQNFGGDILFHF